MSKSYLELIIKIFVEKYEGKLTQKSKEWYENMIHTIGGSCISAVIGENKYKSQLEKQEQEIEKVKKTERSKATEEAEKKFKLQLQKQEQEFQQKVLLNSKE